MGTPSSTTPPSAATSSESDTDNWESTSLDAPRQKAGDVIERQSERRDDATDVDTGDEAEATAERQATGRGPSTAA